MVPVHRALLDHLAGKAASRHPVGDLLDTPALREAVARYIGNLVIINSHALETLDSVGTDLELLARCARLVNPDIQWPNAPEEFAARYVAELRLLGAGPLAGLGVIPPAFQIEIDRDLTWVNEVADRSATADSVRVTEAARRAYVSAPGLAGTIPVTSIRFSGRQGQEIGARVPHLAAFNRAKGELLHRLGERLLPDEGPDIVYERLSRYAVHAWQVLTVNGLTQAGTAVLPWRTKAEVEHLTAHELEDAILDWTRSRTSRDLDRSALGRTLVVWNPQPPMQGILLDAAPSTDDPYDPGQHRPGLALHGAPLLFLVDEAERLGIADVPLHPLGLLPASRSDAVLALPSRTYEMDREQATLYLKRHIVAEMRSTRHVVEASFQGLAARITSYSTLPRRVTLAISESDQMWSGRWTIEGTVENNADADEVRVVDSLAGEWSSLVNDPSIASAFSSSIWSYDGVMVATYKDLASDLGGLLGGEAALGREDL